MDAEALLIQRLMAGDGHALVEIVNRYDALVYGLARRVTTSLSIAEDVAQDVFVELWRRPDRFDPARGSLRAFLAVQAERRAIDAVRSTTRRVHREKRHSELRPAVQSIFATSQPEESAEQDDLAERVRDAVNQLPPAQRMVIELAYYSGRTHREIALELDIPEGTAKSRLRLAHMKLRPLLERQMLQSTQ